MTNNTTPPAPLTDDEREMLEYYINDPDWDVSQRGDVWELLPRLIALGDSAIAARAECERLRVGVDSAQDAADALFHQHESLMLDLCKELKLDYEIAGKANVINAVAALTAAYAAGAEARRVKDAGIARKHRDLLIDQQDGHCNSVADDIAAAIEADKE